MLDKIKAWMGAIIEVGVLLLTIGIVFQVIFGGAVPFIGVDVIGNITSIIKALGESGLVGLIALGVIVALFLRGKK